jgi:phosphate transport system protein
MKIPKLDVNFFKVVTGVCFSLLWARVMYLIWDQPSFITFIWFYLGIGSVLLKWVIFKIIDMINTGIILKKTRKELEQSAIRVREAGKNLEISEEIQADRNYRINTDYNDNLKRLQNKVLLLGDMVNQALENTVAGLRNNDSELIRKVIEKDQVLDNAEFSIREDCLRVISDIKPSGEKLRKILAIMGIGTELERMGDYAEGIANISLMIGTSPLYNAQDSISRMKDIGLEMLNGSIASFLNSDIKMATAICHRDNEVDALYDRTFRELILQMIKDPQTITHVTRLIWVVHNLERFADRATNICELVLYDVTGKNIDIGTSKY